MPIPPESSGVRVIEAQSSKPLGQIVGLAGSFIAALSKATGLTRLETQQQLLLLSLYTVGEMSQADLPKHIGCQRSAVSRNIARLGDGEKPLKERGPGWIETRPDLNDRRNNYVSLTPRGRDVIDRAANEVEPLFRSFAHRQKMTLVGDL